MTTLTPAWHKQSSYRALQLEQENYAIHWKPPHFTLFPMQFCISKLEVTFLNWKTERQTLFSFNPTSKQWRSTVICKSPFPNHPKLEGRIYLHHPEYPDHNLPSTKPGQRGDDPCRQQDAGGSGHAMNEKKIITPYDELLCMVVGQNFISFSSFFCLYLTLKPATESTDMY